MSQTLASTKIGHGVLAEVAHPETASERSLPHDRVLVGEEPSEGIDVSIVVPYYNPGDRLRPTVEHVVRALTSTGMSFEVIAVSDGSTDGSPTTLGGLTTTFVKQVSYPTNVGKGHALRTGFWMARGQYVGFIDADGDISPDFLTSFLATMRDEAPDIVIGTKRHPGSTVHNNRLRRIYSWGYQRLIGVLFSVDVSDSQVGIKLMDRRLLDEVLPLLREERFALDLELLVLAQRNGYRHIVETPVRIEERSQSTISLKAVRRLLTDTMRIFWRTSMRHSYDHTRVEERMARLSGMQQSMESLPRPAGL